MEFKSADPSVVRNIMQRVLLNAWLRAARTHQPLPLLADFQPGDISGELPDMMGYDIEGDSDDARFVIKQEGPASPPPMATSTSTRPSAPTAICTMRSGRNATPVSCRPISPA